jgi:integrase
MTETNAELLRRFSENPQIKMWYDGVAPQLKESTRNQYLIFLMRYLGDETPASFLKRAQEEPRQVAIEIKAKLGELYKQSMNAAHLTKYALKSLFEFHEIEMHVNGKIKVRRVRQKPELTWEQADKIIMETDEPYRSIFTFMKWSGLGEDEFMEIQNSPEIQRKIQAQRGNSKVYVKVNLTPRKSNLDEFFTLTPKQYVPKFPLNTKTYKNRGSELIDPHDLQVIWRRAAKKAKLWTPGLGPHTLRSTFSSQCGKAGVAFAVSEFCMGHGADKYGYSRQVLNEEYAAKELGKLWEYSEHVTTDALKERDAQIEELQGEIRKLNQRFEVLAREKA